jgi:F-box/leucine-rich repeat protein 14
VTRLLRPPLGRMASKNHQFWSKTDISCLYPEILALIFECLDVRDKGRAAQVCVGWRDAAYRRSVWRGVEAKLHIRRANPSLLASLVKRGITKVQILSIRSSLKDVIEGMPKLESLNLSGCYQVTDIALGHAFVQDVDTITVLNLSLCKSVSDSSILRITRHLKSIEVLDLGGCSQITTNSLIRIATGLPKLRHLNLRSCRQVADAGIGVLSGACQPVRIMSESSSALSVIASEKDDTAFHGCHVLESLNLQDCQKLTDQALNYVSSGFQKLSKLNLSFCDGITDSGLKYISKMKSLRELNLRSCHNVSDLGIGFLTEGGSCLTSLDVSFCESIGDASLSHISQGLFHMRSLSLSATNISDDGIEKLVRTTVELTKLDLGQCSRLTDVAIFKIAERLKGLTFIDLYGCEVSAKGHDVLRQLPKLKTLNYNLWCVRS